MHFKFIASLSLLASTSASLGNGNNGNGVGGQCKNAFNVDIESTYECPQGGSFTFSVAGKTCDELQGYLACIHVAEADERSKKYVESVSGSGENCVTDEEANSATIKVNQIQCPLTFPDDEEPFGGSKFCRERCPPSFYNGNNGNGNNRFLEESQTFDVHDPALLLTLQLCQEQVYSSALFVGSHLYGIATPSPEAEQAGCPVVVTHAIVGDENDLTAAVARKEVILIPGTVANDMYPAEGRYDFGDFMLAEIHQALVTAEPSAAEGMLYDVVKNNCANYIVNLGTELGVKIDSDVVSFAARRLLEQSGKDLVEKIRNSVNYFELFSGNGRSLRVKEDVSDEDLVEMLVVNRAQELL